MDGAAVASASKATARLRKLAAGLRRPAAPAVGLDGPYRLIPPVFFALIWCLLLIVTRPDLWFTAVPPAGEGASHWAVLDDIRRVWQTGRLTGYSPDILLGAPVLKLYFPVVPSAAAAVGLFLNDAAATKTLIALSVLSLSPAVVFLLFSAGARRFVAWSGGVAAIVWQMTLWWAYGGKIYIAYAGSSAATFSYTFCLVFAGCLCRRFLPAGRPSSAVFRRSDLMLGVLFGLTVLTHPIAGFWAAAGLLTAGFLSSRWFAAAAVAAVGVVVSAWWVLPALLDEGFYSLGHYPTAVKTLFEWVWWEGCSVNTMVFGLGLIGLPVLLLRRPGGRRFWLLLSVLAASPVLTWAGFWFWPEKVWNQKLLGFWYLGWYLLAAYGIWVYVTLAVEKRTRAALVAVLFGWLLQTAFVAASPAGLIPTRVQSVPIEKRQAGGLTEVSELPAGRLLMPDGGFHPAEQQGWPHSDVKAAFVDSSPSAPYLHVVEQAFTVPDPLRRPRQILPAQHGTNFSEVGSVSGSVSGLPSRQAASLGIGYLALSSGSFDYGLVAGGWEKAGEYGAGCGWKGWSPEAAGKAPVCWSFWSPPAAPMLVESLGSHRYVAEGFETEALKSWQADPNVWVTDRPLPDNGAAEAYGVAISGNEIEFSVERAGVPMLIREGWQPGWRAAEGAGFVARAGPFMAVVPTENTVRLTYGLTFWEKAGYVMSAVGAALLILFLMLWERIPAIQHRGRAGLAQLQPVSKNGRRLSARGR